MEFCKPIAEPKNELSLGMVFILVVFPPLSYIWPSVLNSSEDCEFTHKSLRVWLGSFTKEFRVSQNLSYMLVLTKKP